MKKRLSLYLLYGITIFAFLITTHWGSSVITTMSEGAPIKRRNCILIDPGHGGMDGGATSCSGHLESSYNLEIALRLRDILQFLGHNTKMTRTSDISIHTEGTTIAEQKASDLKARVHLANSTENTLLLSIHQNHFPDDRYSGAQVFYAGTPGSDILAKELQSAFTETLNPASKRKCKQSRGIYLMEHIKCPGILIECGFLSNVREDAMLRDSGYQKELCSVIASSVHRFLSNT